MPEAESRGEGAGRVVLVVEDEPLVLRFLRASLSAHGYRVLEAASGEQGLVEAATRAYLATLDGAARFASGSGRHGAPAS